MTSVQLRIWVLLAGLTGCLRAGDPPALSPPLEAPMRDIRVDGDIGDWQDVPVYTVNHRENLWKTPNLPPEFWKGPEDLSYQWRMAWSNNRLFVLVEVRDQAVMPPKEAFTYLNDSVEIFVDPRALTGKRVVNRELRAFELHFQGIDRPQVYCTRYQTAAPQTEMFVSDWHGEVAMRRTPDGYRLECGFTTPHMSLKEGNEIGIFLAVNDHDGRVDGRETQMILVPTEVRFWSFLDPWPRLTLKGP